MYTGLLHLHNLLRWVILIFLIITLVQSFAARKDPASGKKLQKTSLFLMIAAHTSLLVGLYQWFFGELGFKIFQKSSFGEVMKNSAQRFWGVEHILGMIIAIILITIARRKVKGTAFAAAGWLYLVALVIILASIPWPSREAIGRPWI